MEEEDINFTVKSSISNKMMISWVVQRNSSEEEVRTKVIEKVESGRIIWIAIGISS